MGIFLINERMKLIMSTVELNPFVLPRSFGSNHMVYNLKGEIRRCTENAYRKASKEVIKFEENEVHYWLRDKEEKDHLVTDYRIANRFYELYIQDVIGDAIVFNTVDICRKPVEYFAASFRAINGELSLANELFKDKPSLADLTKSVMKEMEKAISRHIDGLKRKYPSKKYGQVREDHIQSTVLKDELSVIRAMNKERITDEEYTLLKTFYKNFTKRYPTYEPVVTIDGTVKLIILK